MVFKPMIVRKRVLIFTVCIMFMANPVHAQVFIDRIEPPCLPIGQKSIIIVHGQQLKNLTGLWTSLSTNQFIETKVLSTSQTQARLEIDIPPKTAIGLYGLRAITKDGLSNVQLFMSENLPLQQRQLTDTVQPLKWPVSVYGTFREAVVDRYSIEVTAGQRLTFELIGNRFGKDADPLITIRNAKRQVLREHDHDDGLYMDSRFQYQFTETGTYTLEVRDARFRGNPNWPYLLRIGQFASDRVALPVNDHEAFFPSNSQRVSFANERVLDSPMMTIHDQSGCFVPLIKPTYPARIQPVFQHEVRIAKRLAASAEMQVVYQMTPLKANPFAALDRLLPNSSSLAERMDIPCVLSGIFRQPKETHAVWFELKKNQTIWVRAEAKQLNSPVDIDFVIVDKNGREVRRPEANREPIAAEFSAGNPGIYGLVIRDVLQGGSLSHAYQIEIADRQPAPTFTAEVEGLTVPQGSWQPVPISLSRPGGSWKLSLRNAPEGVVISPNVIPDGKTTIICQLSATADTPRITQTIQIIAQEMNVAHPRMGLVRTQPLIDKQLHNVDLIPIGLREDQRRLPPSVTDRFALQIVPPSPIEFNAPAEVLVPRYQLGKVPLNINRVAGFKADVHFTAKGGQLAAKTEGRTRVYAELPTLTNGGTFSDGHIRSLILSNLGKTRVDLTAITKDGEREIRLTRPFEMSIIRAFTLTMTYSKPTLQVGESTVVSIKCDRVPTFKGPIMLKFNQHANSHVELSESITLPAGQSSIEMSLQIPKTANPGKHRVDFTATALVDGFEEEERGQLPEIEVKKPEPTPKK